MEIDLRLLVWGREAGSAVKGGGVEEESILGHSKPSRLRPIGGRIGISTVLLVLGATADFEELRNEPMLCRLFSFGTLGPCKLVLDIDGRLSVESRRLPELRGSNAWKIPRDDLRFREPDSADHPDGATGEGGMLVNVLRLSNLPSKSARSSYSLDATLLRSLFPLLDLEDGFLCGWAKGSKYDEGDGSPFWDRLERVTFEGSHLVNPMPW